MVHVRSHTRRLPDGRETTVRAHIRSRPRRSTTKTDVDVVCFVLFVVIIAIAVIGQISQ